MYRTLAFVYFFFLCFPIIGQTEKARIGLSNTYILTGTPVFGISWEERIKSGFSMVGRFEFGRYAHSRKNIVHASLDSYTAKGVGLLPELRYYFSKKKSSQLLGPFVSAYGRIRRFSESQWDGISITEKGLTISNPNLTERIGWNTQAGVAAGLHIGYQKLRLHAEVLGGYAWGHTSWDGQAPDANAEITQQRASLNGGSTRMECSLIFCL